MAAVTAPSGGSGGGGAGTGFLFGNIDRRGRLEEDYLDEEAKDNIDNVGTTVADRDKDLAEITREAGRGRNPRDIVDDEDYDDDGRQGDDAIDFYDEKDDIEEQQERARMAQIALAPSKRAATADDDDDDENYDDDDDGLSAPSGHAAAKSVPPAASSLRQSATPLGSDGKPLKSATVPAETATPGPASKKARSVAQTRKDDAAAALQRKLIQQAREGREATKVQNTTRYDDESQTLPLKFSQVFTEPLKKIDMRLAKPRSFGVHIKDERPDTATVYDDFEAFDAPPAVPSLNPVSFFLEQDRQKIEELRTAAESGSGKSQANDDVMAVSEYSDDDEEASKPLDASKEPIPEVPASAHDLVQQVPWEDSICWQSDESDPEEYNEDESPKNAQQSEKMDVDNDSDDDDEDDWEEVQSFEVPAKPSASSIPVVPLSQPKLPVSPAARSKPGGLVPLSKPSPLASKPPSLISKPKTLAVNPTNKAKSSSAINKSPHKPPLPPSKSAISKKGVNGVTNSKRGAANSKKVSLHEPATDNCKEANSVKQPVERPPSEFIQQVLRPNRELDEGAWVDDIMWDSGGSDVDAADRKRTERASRLSKLILDPNDPNLIFETTPQEYVETERPSTEPKAPSKMMNINSSLRLRLTDPFNISNDCYYSTGNDTNPNKADRRSLLRGLHNAPPAVKCQTSRNVSSESQLLSWHKPKVPRDFITKVPFELQPFRRRRPKGGLTQIAGQIPKKRSELYCSTRDAYRVALFEYSIEKHPCVLPVPGMASRILTYSRKKSKAEALEASKDCAVKPDQYIEFLAPEEPPPLHAGNVPEDAAPLSVVESHIYSAPCASVIVPETDFLVMRRGGKMHVREIDSVVSLGVTEPKIEVMAPNTDRFKKYARDRVSLYIMREFMKQQKKDIGDGVPRPIPAIDKEQIFREFSRRRTFPETAIIKQLKELAKYQNGRYILNEPSKGFINREAELLRTLTAEETAAFDAMEAGWELLLNHGIRIFTHPSNQCNIIVSGKRTGLRAGPAVGAFIKNQLLQTPWYRTHVITTAQKQQKKDMSQALWLARTVSDLREGGTVMETCLHQLTAGDLQNVLNNHFRIQTRKVPDDVEARRNLVREYTLKRLKSMEKVNYETVINTVITKHRNAGQRGTGNNLQQTSAAHSNAHVIPLDVQRDALERGIVEKLPTELERTNAGEIYEAASVRMSDDAFGKKRSVPESQPNKATNNRPSKKSKSSKSSSSSQSKQTKTTQESDELKQLQKLTKSAAVLGGSQKSKPPNKSKPVKEPKLLVEPPVKPMEIHKLSSKPAPPKPLRANGNGTNSKTNADIMIADKKKSVTKKRPTRLKVTKKVMDRNGNKVSQVTYVTDALEIERILQEKQDKALKKKVNDKTRSGASKDENSTGEGPVKISINLHKLSQGGKAGVKKKPSSSPIERKKPSSSKKRQREADDDTPKASTSIRKVGEKNQIGKIRINTKQIKKEKEEAAQKRLKSQYGEDDYRARKSSKGLTSRKKRNGAIQLNSILEQIEKVVRGTEGYVKHNAPKMEIARLRPGDKPPPSGANNLAAPVGTALDFTKPVDVKAVPKYLQIVKRPMDLGTMRHKCKKMEYQTSKEFLDDMAQIAKNARAFNNSADVQWVVQHAELLLEVAQEQVADKSEEIAAAEDAIQRARSRDSKPKSESRA